MNAKQQGELSRGLRYGHKKPHIISRRIPHLGRTWRVIHVDLTLLGSNWSPSDALRRWTEIIAERKKEAA